MNYNHAVVAGRVTADLQLRTTPSGQSVTSFSVATNRTWTDRDGKKQDDVEFHNIVCFGRTAELASAYLSKGSLALVSGRLQTRSYEDKDGVSRKVTQIIAENIQFGPAPLGTPKPENEPTELAQEETLPAMGDEDDTGRSMERLL